MGRMWRIAVFVVMMIAAGIVLLAIQPSRAQENINRLRPMLERLVSEDVTITIQFAAPLLPGETTWTLPDKDSGRQLATIGDDVVCFSEPWNDGSRIHCTPIANIVSISYLQR